MARHSFGSTGGRVRPRTTRSAGPTKSAADAVREMKKAQQKPAGEDYRERSLAIHGAICARCGREFGGKNLRLLTVHHRDGNHHNNPPDGSNWENLCVYCHDDAHSRGVLGEYVDGAGPGDERRLVYSEDPGGEGSESGVSALGDLLKKAMEKKGKKDR